MRVLAEMEVQPMTFDHVGDVLAIDERVYPRPWSAALYRQELASDRRVHRVALAGDEVIGHAGLMLLHDEGHVSTVAVRPDWQRQGVATRLMLALSHEAIARGMRTMTLEVRMSNDGAQALYRRFGYVPAGVRKNYYVDEPEDALVMWAADIQHVDYRARLDAIENAAQDRRGGRR